MKRKKDLVKLAKELQSVTDKQTILYTRAVHDGKEDIREKLLKIGSQINQVWRKKEFKEGKNLIKATKILGKAKKDLDKLEKLFDGK